MVTENGTFTKDQVSAPVLITSFGQSADVSMLDALMKKVGAEYTFDATASAEDAAGYKTIIIASGASSKGLGAAGISQEDEIARAEAIAQTAKDNDITVIVAHMGGAARRGTLSDQFSDLALGCADYIMVVEEGNDDGKFSDAATDAGIPITCCTPSRRCDPAPGDLRRLNPIALQGGPACQNGWGLFPKADAPPAEAAVCPTPANTPEQEGFDWNLNW